MSAPAFAAHPPVRERGGRPAHQPAQRGLLQRSRQGGGGKEAPWPLTCRYATCPLASGCPPAAPPAPAADSCPFPLPHQFRDTGCGCVSGLAAALADSFAEMTTPGLQGGERPRFNREGGEKGRRGGRLATRPMFHCTPPHTCHPAAVVKVLATAWACPACAPVLPNATGAPAAAPSVQAASKP